MRISTYLLYFVTFQKKKIGKSKKCREGWPPPEMAYPKAMVEPFYQEGVFDVEKMLSIF